MKYSIIVPVFNRPDEVDELLQSLTTQQFKDFEVIIVEDGSTNSCKDVCDKYADILPLHYYYKENSGPGQSRNYGAERAKGEWLIILDSDVVLPEEYLTAVERSLTPVQPKEACKARIPLPLERRVASLKGLNDLSPLLLSVVPMLHIHHSLLYKKPSPTP